MIDTKSYKSLRDCEVEMRMYEKFGQPFPQELQEAIDYWKKKEANIETSDNEYFYRTFIKNSKFEVKQEKLDCIRETVDHLLEEGENAKDPVLLLGKIQCGKTDTFEAIICLAFDRGIDISVVFTKGTKSLTEQTIKRMEHDYVWFEINDDLDCKTIDIEDIMIVWKSLEQAVVDNSKVVIVCKKQSTNLEHLIELFKVNCPFLKEKKVLIIDDEADFASINYRKSHNEDAVGYSLAKISEQIDEFRKIPKYCRYLQVTATPYCLYLQPNGELNLINGKAEPIRPRFTSLVPAHDKYVGGEEYFVKSENEDSMYWHLFHPIDNRCMSILGKIDDRYIEDGIKVEDIYDLTQSIIAYFVAVAIRSIQREKERKSYRSSALFHIDINRAKHDSQYDLIKKLIEDIKDAVIKNDQENRIVWSAVDYYIEDFKESNRKGRNEGLINVDFPTKKEIYTEIHSIFSEDHFRVKVVNSDEQIASLLDKRTGELELKNKANIYIGGSILDRGITVKNMLCFFYGRNPKTFQQDTVLQHARMYGARSKEDMAVTRFHTTTRIYDIMKRMNTNDNQLREWFEKGKDSNYENAVFLGFSKDIKPCAPSKIRTSNALVIKGHTRFLPKGFFTKTNDDIKDTIKEIDNLIVSSSHYNEKDQDGFFEMDQQTVIEILKKIETTYLYDRQYENIDQKGDMSEVISAAIHCADKSGGKFLVMHKTGRKANRILQDGAWAETPYNGENELAPARRVSEKIPVLMLFREEGKIAYPDKEYPDREWVFESQRSKNIGWNNAPFYWPVLLAQENLESVMFALNQRSSDEYVSTVDILEGINPKDVLKLTFAYDLIEHFGEEGRVYDPTDNIYDDPIETRSIRETNASRYIEKTDDGKSYKLKRGVSLDKKHDHRVYSYNKGVFPFIIRPYKYMLLTRGRSSDAEQMLLKLTAPKYWNVFAIKSLNEEGDLVDYIDESKVLVHCKKTVMNKKMDTHEVLDENTCQWVINYQVEKVLKYLPKVKVDNIDTEDDE